MRGDLHAWLAPGRTVRDLGDGVASALPPGDEGAPYDARALVYDRLVRSRLYNRLAWGADPGHYSAFAREAERAGDGPLLDAGAGTTTFTAEHYRESIRPIVVSDRSVAMLRIAQQRLAGAAHLVQADLLDLPFADEAFGTVACFGVLHVLSSAEEATRALLRCVRPGGALFLSSLVAETAVGSRYLELLHRAGEVAAPRTEAAVRAALLAAADGARLELRRTGSMVYARLERREAEGPRAGGP